MILKRRTARLNTIIIVGRLTRDPELRRTQNGTAVTSFTLAVDRDFKNPDGTPVLDEHGHLIVKHDLFNHDGKTQDGIAEAFIEFAKKEKLSFVGKP